VLVFDKQRLRVEIERLFAGNGCMKVYFAPNGIGLGHVGRCVPVARILEEKGAKVVFSTYREGIKYIERENFPLIEAPPIGFQVRPDGSVDFKRTAINPGPFLASFTLLKQVNAEVRTIEHFKPDVVVSDSRATPLLAARVLGIPRVCILNQFQPIVPRRKRLLRLARFADAVTLTLIGRIWTGGNTVLIPDFPQPYTISIGNLTIPKPYRKNVKLIGPILLTKPNELPAREKLREKLKLPTSRPVVFAAVSGPTSEKAFVAGVLRRILLEFPQNYEIIMSLGYPSADSKPIQHGNVTIYKWVPNRFEYLKACDLVIGRAGHGTITQCMCYGKPMILVPTPGHTEQISNAKQAENIGVAKILLQNHLNKERLLQNVQTTLQGKMVERAAEVQKEVLRYDGLENAVKVVTEAAEK
jgi:UDP-N-acetylglucosamine--N-acetylmuramyl-(pentapeptide) pyrophosphoryl-undecaprenol N-acetylglucosamine transferase